IARPRERRGDSSPLAGGPANGGWGHTAFLPPPPSFRSRPEADRPGRAGGGRPRGGGGVPRGGQALGSTPAQPHPGTAGNGVDPPCQVAPPSRVVAIRPSSPTSHPSVADVRQTSCGERGSIAGVAGESSPRLISPWAPPIPNTTPELRLRKSTASQGPRSPPARGCHDLPPSREAKIPAG